MVVKGLKILFLVLSLFGRSGPFIPEVKRSNPPPQILFLNLPCSGLKQPPAGRCVGRRPLLPRHRPFRRIPPVIFFAVLSWGIPFLPLSSASRSGIFYCILGLNLCVDCCRFFATPCRSRHTLLFFCAGGADDFRPSGHIYPPRDSCTAFWPCLTSLYLNWRLSFFPVFYFRASTDVGVILNFYSSFCYSLLGGRCFFAEAAVSHPSCIPHVESSESRF